MNYKNATKFKFEEPTVDLRLLICSAHMHITQRHFVMIKKLLILVNCTLANLDTE
jgi:hypothetical protein